MRLNLGTSTDCQKIDIRHGIIQNLSTSANIELCEDTQQKGIILKPFQTVTICRPVYAKKVSGTGNGILAVMPFENSMPPDFAFDKYKAPAKPHQSYCLPRDEPEEYVIKIPRELIEQGQRKFIVEFPH